MKTKFLSGNNSEDLKLAAETIRRGGLVAIPTETVYGLGANALDEEAVRRIFVVKGRPQDNPLIIHVPRANWMERYCRDIPDAAYKLAEAFWPGPLTMILPRNDKVPDVVTAGLSTVAVRCPDNAATCSIIDLADVPIAAPSANISGSPSPTSAAHVRHDLDGKIEVIVDGGRCDVGLESTIVDLTRKPARLLRPGGITPAQIEAVIGKIEIDAAVYRALEKGEIALAPGMKYRHYAPRARVTILKGASEAAAAYANARTDPQTAVLCYDEEQGLYTAETVLAYGSRSDESSLARNLFDSLRSLDREGIEQIFARCPEGMGVALAVSNRLKKAAGYHIVDVEE